jgi:hypothetical protein
MKLSGGFRRHNYTVLLKNFMLTIGSVSRDEASGKFPFLAERFSGRRRAIKDFTHFAPDFVFWIYPDGTLHDAKNAHRSNVPSGFEYILDDEPEYGGFLRGRLASNHGDQLLVVYCREDALATDRAKIEQFLDGISQLPVPVAEDVLVVSDNADIYGTLEDIEERLSAPNQEAEQAAS